METVEPNKLAPEAGAVVAGRYRLDRPLSEGAMGSVWLATHLGLDIACAVKFMQPSLTHSEELVKRFEREAKAAASIKSPHVVQMLDHGVWNGAPYIAMELLEGEDLAQRLERRGSLPGLEVVAIASQIGRALAQAHAKGLVHRDLKPENIFLSMDDDRELVKILDFGVVRVGDLDGCSKATRAGAMIGTPSYMSPEQAMGADVDLRADLWSMAVVVYECLTGKLPFDGGTIFETAMLIVESPMPVPSKVALVPAGFDAWWSKAASRKVEARFSSAKEQIEALAAALAVPNRSLMPRGRFSGAPKAINAPLPIVIVDVKPVELASVKKAEVEAEPASIAPRAPSVPEGVACTGSGDIVLSAVKPRRRYAIAAAGALALLSLAGFIKHSHATLVEPVAAAAAPSEIVEAPPAPAPSASASEVEAPSVTASAVASAPVATASAKSAPPAARPKTQPANAPMLNMKWRNAWQPEAIKRSPSPPKKH